MPKLHNVTNGDKDTLRCMKRAFLVSNVTILTPCRLHSSETAPGNISSAWKIIVWSFHFIMMLVYVTHLTLRCWITYHDKSLQQWKKIYVEFLTIQMSLLAWLQTANYFNREKLPYFMGRYIKFFQSAKG